MDNLVLAAGAFLGALLTALAAILSARKEESGMRARLILLAMGGVLASGICILVQYRQAVEDGVERDKAQKTLQATKAELDRTQADVQAASVNLDDLAQLNTLSKERYFVQLSADPEPCRPCEVARRIDRQFPGALANQGIRVIDVTGGSEPYHLIFGHALSLAAAEVFERLAIAHNLANQLPPIVHETGSENVVDCPQRCPR